MGGVTPRGASKDEKVGLGVIEIVLAHAPLEMDRPTQGERELELGIPVQDGLRERPLSLPVHAQNADPHEAVSTAEIEKLACLKREVFSATPLVDQLSLGEIAVGVAKVEASGGGGAFMKRERRGSRPGPQVGGAIELIGGAAGLDYGREAAR